MITIIIIIIASSIWLLPWSCHYCFIRPRSARRHQLRTSASVLFRSQLGDRSLQTAKQRWQNSHQSLLCYRIVSIWRFRNALKTHFCLTRTWRFCVAHKCHFYCYCYYYYYYYILTPKLFNFHDDIIVCGLRWFAILIACDNSRQTSISWDDQQRYPTSTSTGSGMGNRFEVSVVNRPRVR